MKTNAFEPLFEKLSRLPGYERRSYFGGLALYFEGKQLFFLADGQAPWAGVLLCTDYAHHPTLLADFRALRPHTILGKWLYVAALDPAFESTVAALIEAALRRDLRLGIVPQPKKSRKKKVATAPAAGDDGDPRPPHLR